MNNLPLDLQHPGGFVEEVMDYINENAVCPQPMFALGAALTLAGTLYGRRVQGTDGQRTNLFAMSIGYTSSGKDQALKSIARILDSCNASHLRLGQVTSDSAIEWALKRQPRLCLLIDEAGYFFGNASDAKAKGSPQHAIKPALLELWSSANARWVGKQRVPKDGKSETPPVVIDNPHLCLYSTSQPQILFEGLTRNDLRDGWLARNLFFISTTRPKPQFKEEKPVPNAIRAVVYAYKNEGSGIGDQGSGIWYQGSGIGDQGSGIGDQGSGIGYQGSGIGDQGSGIGDQGSGIGYQGSGIGDQGSGIVTVPTDEDAAAVFAAFNDRIYAKMLAADKSGDEANYLYGKALENARRVALILAVSRVGENPLRARIGKADAEYATKLVGFLISTVIETVQESLSENADEKAKKRILKVIASGGPKGVTRNELTRKTQFIRRSMRDEYLEDLVDAGEIVMRENKGHVGQIYFLGGVSE